MRLRNCLMMILLLVSAAAMADGNVTCGIDNSTSYFTGRTQTAENGKQMWLYRCIMFGHEFWVVK